MVRTTRDLRLGSLMVALGLAAVLAGCGGKSSSVSGPGGSGGTDSASGAVVEGQVRQGRLAALEEPRVIVVLEAILGVRVAEAAVGDPVSGATVVLSGPNGTFTTTTDANGQFTFQNVPPGTYTLTVTPPPPLTAPLPTSFIVGVGDKAVVGVVTEGTPPTVQVVAISTDVLQNDAQLGHAVNIANASSSCDLVDVTTLRDGGLGWGEIARQCSVPPSVIGLGRSNVSDGELAEAREEVGRGRGQGGGKGKGKGKNA